MKSTVMDESLSSFKPMYCSREYQASTRSQKESSFVLLVKEQYGDVQKNNLMKKKQLNHLALYIINQCFGKDTKERTSWGLEWALATGGNKLFGTL